MALCSGIHGTVKHVLQKLYSHTHQVNAAPVAQQKVACSKCCIVVFTIKEEH